jgi:hypothetical protein
MELYREGKLTDDRAPYHYRHNEEQEDESFAVVALSEIGKWVQMGKELREQEMKIMWGE